MLRRTLLSRPLLACLVLSTCLGCASTGKSSEQSTEDDRYVQRVATDAQKNSGMILTELDGALKLWANLTATGDKSKDGQRVNALEEDLRYRAGKNFDLLASELEVGPTRNRMIAAMAIGFSGRSEALSILLNALEDPDDRVEINALIGLSQLQSPNTPLSEITLRMSEDPNPEVRAMASSALVYCLQAGADGSDVLGHARRGLNDEEPVVRMNSALVLGELKNAESIPAISDLLYDEVPLVVRAARHSLTYIGIHDDHARGEAARALTAALLKAPDRKEEKTLILYLQKLSNINHGDKVEDWVSWADGMP
jgi:HEAT repeat protein